MVVVEGRLDVKLTSPLVLQQLMQHNGYTVRSLADDATKVLRRKRTGLVCKRGTVGNLRSGYRKACSAPVARAIAECLNVPVEALFHANVSNVQREVRRNAA